MPCFLSITIVFWQIFLSELRRKKFYKKVSMIIYWNIHLKYVLTLMKITLKMNAGPIDFYHKIEEES